MYDLPSEENVEEVIVDLSAAKGQSQPGIVPLKIIRLRKKRPQQHKKRVNKY